MLGLMGLQPGVLLAGAHHWPQWRGPLATGESPDAESPLKWSEAEHVRWKVPVPGSGTSTPIVSHGKVFLLTAIRTEPKGDQPPAPPPAPAAPERGGFGRSEPPSVPYRFVVLCLDQANGKTLWEKAVTEGVPHEGHHRDHGFASASPVTDGRTLVASFGSRGVHALDLAGNLKWSKDLGRMRTRNGFGEGSSPALHGDIVVVLWDHEGDDFIVALDRETGRELWRVPREEATTWTTPLVVEHAGKALVVVPATARTRCYELATGEQSWEAPGLTANVIPSAVAQGGVVYVTSGFRGSVLRAIKLGGGGDLAGTDSLLWSQDRNTPYVPSPLLAGGALYFLSGNNGLLSCVDVATGKAHYSAERLPGIQNVYASPVAGGGRVYVLSREGVCLVLKQGPKLEVLATNKLDEPTDASIALAGRDLFIRGRDHLYCIAEP
jgi:outer membrane protein assembly factor BamB